MKELVEIQRQLKAPKNQFNNFGKYKYRSAEDIIAAAKPLYTELGCFLILNDSIKEMGGRYYVAATATLYNSENAEISATGYAREAENKKGMDAAQITGATSSYARKYALNGLFALDDNESIDASKPDDSVDYIQQLKQKLDKFDGEKKADIETYVSEREQAGELTQELAKKIIRRLK
jgi:hypothetical protein